MKLEHPFNAIISGPTQAGKSELCKKLLKLINPAPDFVIWCYGVKQPWFSQYPFEFVKGMPALEWDTSKQVAIVLDDLFMDVNSETAKLFCNDTHHKNASVFLISQNLFPKNPYFRTLSLNAHYLFLFKNPRDTQQIKVLGRQMGKPKFLEEAFKMATQENYKYLCLDLKPQTDERLRVRSHIFPGEPNYVYLPQNETFAETEIHA